jgi:3-hydroxyacyl-[acyl-carrier-protein] dehydratase
MIMNHAQIKAVLPHRYPMLLVDAVDALEPGSEITASKSITGNESCFAHLHDTAAPEAYAYPSSLVIESFCQAAGILYATAEADKTFDGMVMLFGSISSFVFHTSAYPGETLQHRVRLDRALTDSAVFSGEVRAAGKLVADVSRVVVAVRPAAVLAAAAAE